MISLQVDLGQILLGALMTALAWLVKRELNTFDFRLNRHDDILTKLISDTQRLIGMVQIKEIENRK